MEQLADVYRYVLLAQGHATVPLAEELAFVGTCIAIAGRDNTEGNLVMLQRKIRQHRHLLRTKDLLVLGTF